MAIAVPTIEQVAAKWARVTPSRAADYEAGVRNPRRDWAANTAAAADNYNAGVQAAISEGRFAKGVAKAGNSTWQDRTILLGPSRWTQGVQASEGRFATGFAKFLAALGNINLPPRFARRDPRNLERVRAVVEAMIATAQTQ